MDACPVCGKEVKRKQSKTCSQRCGALNRVYDLWKPEITQEMHEIIEGMLLSDSYMQVQKTARHPWFGLCQSLDHKDYCEFAADLFKLPRERINQYEWISKQTGKLQRSCTFKTTTSPVFDKYFARWYPDGTKIIPKDFKLSPLTLLHEFLGDGSCSEYKSYNNYYWRVNLYSNGLPKDDVLRLKNMLETIGIDGIYNKGKNAIDINKEDSIDRFFEYIGENPVECYNYKFERARKLIA